MKQPSSHALCAKAIRNELKKAYPNTKFSVTSESFSMGNAVRINWDNGPTVEMVDAITGKYEYGHFDGMTDSYEYSNRRNDIPQIKYVTTNRTVTNDIQEAIFDHLKKTHADYENAKGIDDWLESLGAGYRTARQYIYRITCKLDMSKPFNLNEILYLI